MAEWHFLEAAGSLGFTIALIPQLFRTLKRKRAKDVDVSFLLLVLASSATLLLFATKNGLYFFAASLVGNLIVWSVVLYYRLWPKQPYLDPAAEL